ncbi:MAG: preprotein translocase subunit YajC [Candidatus Aminicenantes bacterium RBG_19FT_COMBO_65_30]|nr:MAG: preprotein translocase subunit YajC [Candidatus Aminicenantes bacterium RBG_19FT_COMBO_65_30]
MIFGALTSLALQAGGAPAARPNMLGALLPFVLVFVIFYLLIIMPQRKKQKKHIELVENLKPGDRVITTAGIFGTVMGVQKDLIELKIASNTNIKITKSAVGVIRGATDRLEGE